MSAFQRVLRSVTRPCPSLRQSTYSSIRPSLNISSPRFHTTGPTKPVAQITSPLFARPAPFAQRLDKLISQSKPFRRQYSSYYDNPEKARASYKSAKRAIWSIILINTGVFVSWIWAESKARRGDTKALHFLYQNFILSEPNLAQGRYHTMLTSAFSHKDLLHFGFNMFVLSTFGGLLAQIPFIGARHIYLLALTSSIASSAAFIFHRRSQKALQSSGKSWNPFSTSGRAARTQKIEHALGASGFVMATGSMAACLMPFTPMLIMGVVPAPLWAATLLFAAVDLFLLDSESSRVGHSAHLGGYAFGIVYYLALLRKKGGVWQLVSRKR
ncbi:hypothetical protein BST61_g5999 [Cercospora zeina]